MRWNGIIHFGLKLIQLILWISFPLRLPQLLCIHIIQYLNIRVRHRYSLIDRLLQSVFGCQVNNTVSPDGNMPWNPSKNNMSLLSQISLEYKFNKSTKSGSSHLQFVVDFKTQPKGQAVKPWQLYTRGMVFRGLKK